MSTNVANATDLLINDDPTGTVLALYSFEDTRNLSPSKNTPAVTVAQSLVISAPTETSSPYRENSRLVRSRSGPTNSSRRTECVRAIHWRWPMSKTSESAKDVADDYGIPHILLNGSDDSTVSGNDEE